MASGCWFKKLWSIYSEEEQTEWKQPQEQQLAQAAPKNTPPKPFTLLQSLNAAGPAIVLSEDDLLASGEEDDRSGEEEVDVGGAGSNNSLKLPSVGRSTVGEKSPRFEAAFSEWVSEICNTKNGKRKERRSAGARKF